MARRGWSVSGPETDRAGIVSRGVAVSYAIGRASARLKDPEPSTFYVRDPEEKVRVRVEAGQGAVDIIPERS